VLFGAGSLGRALAGYRGFEKHNIRIAAIVDVDPSKVGQMIGDISVEALEKLKKIRERTDARIAVIAVPAPAALEVTKEVLAAGFDGIVNFAPVRLHLPENIALYSVDLSIAFENITYKLKGGK
ncbi:MAG: redox-sensing transcriptional repressor Rex, partial [Candidatus Hydrogenedentota bacterium]